MLKTICIIGILLLCHNTILCQSIPRAMFDANYTNKAYFLNNPNNAPWNTGDIELNLLNNFEINALGLFLRNFKSEHHKLYGGIGFNYSEYQIKRNLFKEKTETGHFANYYSYSPNKLEYKMNAIRVHISLAHYTFYKKVFLFQKIGIGYNAFLKNTSASSEYTEIYGNSYPTTDSSYITVDNPSGWHFIDSYTYTKKNDLDNYKNGFNILYKFGVGIRIKQFAPFVDFEYSYISTKIPSTYFKIEIGLNYSILSR